MEGSVFELQGSHTTAGCAGGTQGPLSAEWGGWQPVTKPEAERSQEHKSLKKKRRKKGKDQRGGCSAASAGLKAGLEAAGQAGEGGGLILWLQTTQGRLGRSIPFAAHGEAGNGHGQCRQRSHEAVGWWHSAVTQSALDPVSSVSLGKSGMMGCQGRRFSCVFPGRELTHGCCTPSS